MSDPGSGVEDDRALRHGPGRVLVAVYAVFALSATARAAFQIVHQFHHAPLAYLLSAFSGIVYILATVGLSRASRLSRRLALVAISIELLGVLVVGTLTVADSSAFADSTVWSDYGSGYGYVPLVLPVLGLLWLRRTGRRSASTRPV